MLLFFLYIPNFRYSVTIPMGSILLLLPDDNHIPVHGSNFQYPSFF